MTTVPWTLHLANRFSEEAMLTDEEDQVLRAVIHGKSRLQIAYALHVSLATVDRRIASLRRKYDILRRYDDSYPPRRM